MSNTHELPAEVRTAVQTLRLVGTTGTECIETIRRAHDCADWLEANWPKPPQPSADVEKLAEEIDRTVAACRLIEAPLTENIAPILAREFAPLHAEIARLNKALNGEEERAGIEISRRGEAERRAERAEAELAALHGRIGLFAAKWYLISDNLPTDETFKQMETEIADAANKHMALMSERDQLKADCEDLKKLNVSMIWEGVNKDLAAERDQLRAEVERLSAPRSTLRSPADVKEIADLRAQLADARREVERLTNASIADGTRRFLCSQELAFAFQAWRERMDKELRNSVSCETYRAVWADCEQLRAEVARLTERLFHWEAKGFDGYNFYRISEIADLRAQLATLEASERKAHYEREDARQALELCRTELAAAQEALRLAHLYFSGEALPTKPQLVEAIEKAVAPLRKGARQ